MLPILIAFIVILSTIYLISSLFRKREGGGDSVDAKKASKSAKVQESAKSWSLRNRFSIPEGGKVTLAVDRIKWEQNFDSVYAISFQDFLSTLTENCKVYILVQSKSDEEESDFNNSFKERFPQFDSHRILHCEGNTGKIAFIRQLSPHLHIEYDTEVYKSIKPHIHNILVQRNSRECLKESSVVSFDTYLELVNNT